ncbi:hypothetical protein SCHPADRAFT_934042 [Schizopora paradoxa]|uniref:Uncharacterized protein n=1 Tax=Schizopora paradoxa TaxID=27342 RepID=A0A0H2R4D8_9AGAM|nr:hypothetical protein SCHPADRAFT_934042 [Schizopora paradoxa]
MYEHQKPKAVVHTMRSSIGCKIVVERIDLEGELADRSRTPRGNTCFDGDALTRRCQRLVFKLSSDDDGRWSRRPHTRVRVTIRYWDSRPQRTPSLSILVMRVRMDPRSTMEKNSPKLSDEEDQALAKRRRQRAAKKDRKRRQRSVAAAAHDEQRTVVEEDVVQKKDSNVEKEMDGTTEKETSRVDWADEVDASTYCLQPAFVAELPPRDLSCLRTNIRSPWCNGRLCAQHEVELGI